MSPRSTDLVTHNNNSNSGGVANLTRVLNQPQLPADEQLQRCFLLRNSARLGREVTGDKHGVW